MNVLRTVNDIQLNEGTSSARGMFNLSDDKDVSYWFASDTKDDLMEMNDAEFWHKAKDMIKESNIE